MLAAAVLSLLIWLYLLLCRGGFWRAGERLPAAPGAPEAWPEVIALIPARDEAATIGRAVRSHVESGYPGRLSVIVVDDASADGTAEVAREAVWRGEREVHVIAAPPLEPGWTGKLSALAAGARAAEELAPEARYLLLTDADIVHAPETLARLVALAEGRGLALASLMARLDARGWGALLIPAFVFFFQKLYPFPWVNDHARETAGAAGGCMLVRRAALARAGGLAPIRGALIDDCALAAMLKRGAAGGAIWLGLADGEVVSLRDNRRLGTVWRVVARTAFTQLGRSTAMLMAALLGMAVTYLAGPVAVLALPLHDDAAAAMVGAGAWGLSAVAYWPTLRLYGKPAWQAAGLPVAGLLYGAMTAHSAWAHWRGRGGGWKGRTY